MSNARQTDTLLDDFIFGMFLCMFPRAHVLYAPDVHESAQSHSDAHSRERLEQLPLTLRFASVGDSMGGRAGTFPGHYICHTNPSICP